MDATLTLVDLAGYVALLLWGVHMVQTGVQRAFGPELRGILATALGNRLRAFAAGLGVTAVLQSSTATGLMMAGFAASGLVELVPALAAMLGANVGTTLIVQVLSFNVAGLAPLLVLIGLILFRRGHSARARDLGRVAIGLGLMLLALHRLLLVVSPFEDVPSLRLLLGSLTTQPVLDVLLAAILTWAAHSSVAMVLLVMSLAAKGAVPPDAAFALVMGANLGSAINPLLEGVRGEDPVARRLPLGNLLNRVAGCVVGLLLLDWLGARLVAWVPDGSRSVAMFHTGFNLALAMVFLPLLGPYAALLRRWLPARLDAADPARPLYLDPAALDSPPVALGAASREALRMADTLEAVLLSATDALAGDDRARVGETRRLEDVLDRLDGAIRAYLGQLDPEATSEADARRLNQVLAFATNLESAGDVVDHNLMAHAARRFKRGVPLRPDEAAEIRRLMQRVTSNLRLAVSVFLNEDSRAASRLLAEKEWFRNIEAAAINTRIRRAQGAAEMETTNIELDLLRDVIRVNDHLVGAAAYPVLEEQGLLLPSRLRLEE